MRIVADTNVVASGLLWGGNPEKLLIAARERRVALYTSPALIAELEEVVSRRKFVKPLAQAGSSAEQLVDDYLALTEIVVPRYVPQVARDPDDDQVLACALAAQADIIVSGDNDLLELKSFRGIPVLTATAAVEKIARAR